ncbi:hypothetical protein [Lujinxingia litoralis]|uniref:hypothetical protein n=1 Tax=Lujinxingia litoralis TaxID=2211119 RepID=UPI0013145ABD|nr:hypothetical protein [Lujinxingia litoralis]
MGSLLWGCGDPPPQEPPLVVVDDDGPGWRVEEIRVEPATLHLVQGERRPLEVRFFDRHGAPVNAPELLADVVWTSHDPSVVAIEAGGELRGAGEGSAQVEVRFEDLEQVVDVEVRYERWRKVSLSYGRTCALNWEGEVYCWGANTEGLIRSESPTGMVFEEPTRRTGLSDIVDIALTYSHACAADRRGRVYCWGDNRGNQAGMEGADLVPNPLRVGELEGIAKVAVGRQHSCALSHEGEMHCWGNNVEGAIGEGAGVSIAWPFKIAIDEAIDAMALNSSNTCALTESGKVYCWGNNRNGVVNPRREESNIPRPERIVLPGRAQSVAVSVLAACAVLNNGEPYCWGQNATGNIGFLPNIELYDPTRVPEVPALSHVEMSPYGVCGLSTTEELWCWGVNVHGQLGHGVKSRHAEPAKVIGEHRWQAVELSDDTTCGLDTDGEIWCWGRNDTAQVGDGRQVTGHPLRPVRGEARFSKLVTSYFSNCGQLLDDHRWKCWGRNEEKQMQSTESGSISVPSDLQPWQPTELALGGMTGCGLVFSGENRSEAMCWGANSSQGLGLNHPSLGLLDPMVMDQGYRSFQEISLNLNHGCGVAGSGEIWCWGNNYYGEVGMNPNLYAGRPRRVEERSDYVSVSAGFYHSCGLTAGGEIRCWGNNAYGQLGRAATQEWGEAQTIASEATYVEVEAGNVTTCARTSEGEVHCWGSRGFFGGPFTSSTATEPMILSGAWEDMELYADTVCALREGQVSCAGDNRSALITEGGQPYISDFYQLSLDVEVTQVSLGQWHLCVLDPEGRAHCKGFNLFGELGDGAMVEHLEPYPLQSVPR